MTKAENSIVDWMISDDLVDYETALEAMEDRVTNIHSGRANECVWLLEHPPIYTSGTSALPEDLFNPFDFPVYKAGRGGQFTYHGPGQRVAYVMLNVGNRGRDVRQFIQSLEEWIIATLSSFDVTGEIREGRVGVWVNSAATGGTIREDKIAAIGVRLRKWVSFHGISLNIDPELLHFSGIVPCGISEPGLGVTSLTDLGRSVSMKDVDAALQSKFEEIFQCHTRLAQPPS